MSFYSSILSKTAALLITLSLFLSAGGIAAAETALVESLRDYPASLRSENLSVPVLLRSIGRQAGINIFVPETITGEMSLEMEDVSLYEIFHVVIKTNKLHFSESNQVIIIETMKAYLESGRGIVTERLCTDFGNGAEIKGQLETLLSERGSISVTSNDSCLLINDRQENIGKIKVMLAEIDQPIPQIHIESRIVVISKEGRDKLGIKWGMQGASDRVIQSALGTVTGAMDLGIPTAASHVAFGVVWNNFTLDVDLQALLEDNMLQVLSAPSLLVLDGQTAKIKNGKEVPYTSQSGDTSNTQFREAVLSLEVTPKISKDTYIRLKVAVTNDSVDQTNDNDGEPLINRQEINTMLFLEDMSTVVIGGIHVSGDDLDISKVHGLSSIPLLGGLFKSRAKTTTNYELMIFLTPTIISMDTLVGQSQKKAEELDKTLSPQVHKSFKPETYQRPGDRDKDPGNPVITTEADLE
ncbi:MAG: hypothetical protein PF442_07480 [Desulfobulbaceae bacterium]|jgi:type IV pilus assembly protein PilQ|nr:hypothetical protein [Desulfobulbaceae bacterium]